jgi:hypothetical protein
MFENCSLRQCMCVCVVSMRRTVQRPASHPRRLSSEFTHRVHSRCVQRSVAVACATFASSFICHDLQLVRLIHLSQHCSFC